MATGTVSMFLKDLYKFSGGMIPVIKCVSRYLFVFVDKLSLISMEEILYLDFICM